MIEHQTEQELHSYLLENFNRIFNCQIVGHEVKLNGGIVDFVGEEGDTLYLIEIKRDKIQSYTIEQIEGYIDAYKRYGFKEIPNKEYKNIIGVVAAPKIASHLKNRKIPGEIKILTLEKISTLKFNETRINVWVEPELYQKIKASAVLEGVTLKEFVKEALKEKLKKK